MSRSLYASLTSPLLALGLLLSSSAFAHTPPTTTWLSEPRAGITPWLTAIAHAHRIDVNEYLLTDSRLITALRTAAARGATVNILIDGRPYDDASAVTTTETAFRGSRVHLRLAPPRFTGAYAYDHAKYWIFFNSQTTQASAIFGSPNGTASAFNGTNAEDALTTTNSAILHALTTVFTADWSHHLAGAAPRHTLVLSPGAQPALVHLLQSPGPLAIVTEELGDAPAIYQAFRATHRSVQLLVPATLSASDRAEAARLIHAGVVIRTLTSPYVHAKLIVTAHAVFVGSQNFSEPSLDSNREVGLITSNGSIHTQALAWFHSLWLHAVPWTPSTPAPSPTPYLPNGDTPAQVRAAWGSPTTILHNTYDGHPQTVWVYPAGRVDFQSGQVTDVQRSASSHP